MTKLERVREEIEALLVARQRFDWDGDKHARYHDLCAQEERLLKQSGRDLSREVLGTGVQPSDDPSQRRSTA